MNILNTNLNKDILDNSVAVIIVNYNDSSRTISLIERIINFKTISYVIVVNNSSTDNSFELLSEINNSKFVLINAVKNGGYGYGNNLGILKANELGVKFSLICNPDVVFSEETLVTMVETFKFDNKIAIVNARETYLGNFAWKYTSDFEDVLSASLFFNKILKSRYYDDEYFLNKQIVEVDVIQGSFLLVPTKIMIKYGLYDESFFLYEEEKVLFKKISSAGYKSVTNLTVTYEHRHEDHKIKKISTYLQLKNRLLTSKLLFLKKYRNFNKFQLIIAKLFFYLTYIEMLLYSFIIILKGRLKGLKNK